MPIGSVVDLADQLRRYRLLEPAQAEQLASMQASLPDPRGLARELIRRGWLTPYQINQLFQGRGQDLLLGSYVLLERLGEGGMGQVFKARNWKLGRVVALKVIRKERLASADAVRRFHRESRAAAQLDHPNIVRAFDADEAGGTHFFAMEYVEGTDLARLVKQHGPLPVAQACDWIRQAALGLQHAHERGLVHRDIKPHNLLLTRDGVVKILDMGLARLTAGEDGDHSTTMTQEGAVMGTPDYMAPEQAEESHTVDIRGDLYGLGCTLYHLLTGKVPFPGGTLIQKLKKHQTSVPVPIEQLRPGVPPAVAGVVRKLMAKRPEDRYQTPAELAAALSASMTSAPPPSPDEASPTVTAAGFDWSLSLTPTERTTADTPPPARPAFRCRGLVLAGGGGVLVLAIVLLVFLLRPRPDVASPSTPGPNSTSVPEAGSVPGFFNGQDLTGWDGYARYWSVKDGAIIGQTPEAVPFNTCLCSKKTYTDFELSFKVRLKGGFGNSGVQVRSTLTDPGKFIVVGPQGDIGEGFWGSLYGEGAGGMMKAAPPARVRKVLRPDDFNDYSIRCAGKHVTIRLNGETTVDDDFDMLPDRGIIAFQLHAKYAGMEVTFKDVRFTPLGGGDSLPVPADPKRDVPLTPPPQGAEVLFDGKNLDGWVRKNGEPGSWELLPGGAMQVRGGDILTRRTFGGSYRLHVEFRVPHMPGARGQARGNSGVYLQGRYEVQVLDSYGVESSPQVCGAIYNVAAPLRNVCKLPMVWQSYDIEYTSPRCAGGEATEPARMTVYHNGVKIHDDVRLETNGKAVTDTGLGVGGDNICTPGPILLQDHRDPVQFRNIWLLPSN